ncbi:lipopolysaccharide assembly protein LapB, partial [Trichocoleus sp. FACHB-262]|uniref:tetratricopeptide repeat protein n=1 Tax=Trichocoleus sp. FACHB-262 TaxID=2692869 RepID=UPI001688FFAA
MARKWAVFLSRVQSFLAIHRKSWLIKYVLIFTFAWSLTLLPSLLPNFGLTISRFKASAIAQSSVAQPPADSGSILSQQAQQFYEQGDLETAVSKLKQAIEQFRVNGDTLQQTQAWSNLSLIHQARADWRQAEIAIANSIRLAQLSSTQTSSWLSVQAQALETQAKLNFSMGQFELATQAWNQATQYYSQAKNEPGAVRTQLGHSLTLQEMGLHREALKQLLKLSENRPAALTTDPSLQATCLRSLGNAVRIVSFVEIQEAGQSKTLTVSELGQHCGVTLSASAGTKVDYLDQATDLLQKAIALASSPQMRVEIALLLGHTAQDKLRQIQDTCERQPTQFSNYLLTQYLLTQVKTISQAYEQAAQSSDALISAQAKVSQLSVLIDFDRWLQRQETQLQQQASNPEIPHEKATLEAIADLRQDLKQPLINQQAQLPDLIDQLNRLSPSHTAFYTRLRLAHSLLPVPNSQTRIEPTTSPQEQMLALLQ